MIIASKKKEIRPALNMQYSNIIQYRFLYTFKELEFLLYFFVASLFSSNEF